jgi:hypothetical protein
MGEGASTGRGGPARAGGAIGGGGDGQGRTGRGGGQHGLGGARARGASTGEERPMGALCIGFTLGGGG